MIFPPTFNPFKQIVCGFVAASFIFSCSATWTIAADATTLPTPIANADFSARQLEGKWLPRLADGWHSSMLSELRHSTLTVHGPAFALTNYREIPTNIVGTWTIDATAGPKAIDFIMHEFDLSPSGAPVKWPAARVPGIYKIDNDVLTICIQTGSDPVRPTTFSDDADGTILLIFQRAGANFAGYPNTVTFAVQDLAGRPVKGKPIFSFMRMLHDVQDPASAWRVPYGLSSFTDESGKTQISYDDFEAAGIYDQDAHAIGFATASPAMLQNGQASITVEPQCLLTGNLTCDALSKAGKSLGWTNVYLMKNGFRVGMCDSEKGQFVFPVSSGDYSLYVYGALCQKKIVRVTVPVGVSKYDVPPIALVASRLQELKGHPAPELKGVVGWKGTPTTLANLRGRYVLIDFWGYWCNPCVRAIPVLMDLQNKFDYKDLAILSVHIDLDGDVDTAAKLDQKVADYRKTLWSGRDLPFPTALSKGTETADGYDGATAAQYGVLQYPTTILIDRRGNVVGEFDDARNLSAAEAKIKSLIAEAK